GQAQILKAPGPRSTSSVRENLGLFRARVEVPGSDPYELDVTQSFEGGYESEGLKEGAIVECRIDAKNPKRVLLIAPEANQPRVTGVDSSDILREGMRATARIERSNRLEMTAPGTGDPMYELVMEMRSEDESEPWRIRIGQRVPADAEEMVSEGRELTVAYLEVDAGHSAAVDWPATSSGRFS
ncbi:MAG TPA: hypothetical protein VHU24_10185, partial [Solirubrobacterales bacterium]|nr:hypothetical protein [Solirubrobacterales bacterium]